VPKRIDSKLWLYDCINCDKCIPVCPNDANFYYEIDPVEIAFTNYSWSDGQLQPADSGTLKIEKKHQIANFADWCNECGNCDTFCPEYGGRSSKNRASLPTAPRGWITPATDSISPAEWTDGNRGPHGGQDLFPDARQIAANRALSGWRHRSGISTLKRNKIVNVKALAGPVAKHRIDVKTYHTLRILLVGCSIPAASTR